MKHRILTLTLLLTAITFAAEANPVDMNTAREVALKFVNANTKTHLRGAEELQLVTTYSISRGDAAFHIFNTPNGFVIVAADDCATPILGYSDEGRPFDPDNVPVQLQDYLQGFVEQIEYGIENHIVADENTVRQWELVQAMGRLNDNRDGEAVEPLVTAIWDQACYYNAMCPENGSGPCGHCVTGCVATAMGMIMHYWGYPTHGNRSHTSIGYPEQTVHFGETIYDWANMPDYLEETSTQAEIDAVSTLLWHCGVAVDMLYGPGSSGAYSGEVPDVLSVYFGYSDGIANQWKGDDESWLAQVKENLNLGYPLYYRGDDVNGYDSHAWVCDGYNISDQLHFNWGWGGSGNGYFALDALNVMGYQFNINHSAIFNIVPKCEQGTMFQVSVTSNSETMGSVSGGGTVACSDRCTLTASPEDGYQFDYWTEDGVFVSAETPYTFTVTEDMAMEAHFSVHKIEVFAAATPITGGNISGNSNTAVLSYDNGVYEAAMGTMGYNCFYWGVSFPPDKLAGMNGMILSKVCIYDNCAYDGEVLVYQGSTGAPGPETLVFRQDYHCSGSNAFLEIPLAQPVPIDTTQDMWIALHNFNGHYVAAYSANHADNAEWFGFDTGDNGWVGIGYGAWMIRGYVSSNDANANRQGDYWLGYFSDGEVCSITAVPEEGCYFTNWAENGEIVSTEETYSFEVTGNRSIAANFTLSVVANANPENGGEVTGGGVFNYGDNCSVSATANSQDGYQFYCWTENGETISTDNCYSFTVTKARSLVARFGFPLTVSAGMTIEDAGVIGGMGMYDYGDTCTLTVTPNEGYVFLKWVENGVVVSTNAEYSFSVTADRDLVACLAEEGTTCNMLFGGSVDFGNYLVVTCDDNTVEYMTLPNFELTYTRKMLAGSHITLSWISGYRPDVCMFSIMYENGAYIIQAPSDEFGIWEINDDFHFEFDVDCSWAYSNYAVTAVPNIEDGGSVEGAGEYLWGTTCTLTAIPSEGYGFMYWTENGEILSWDAVYTFTVNEAKDLVAHFASEEIEFCNVVFELGGFWVPGVTLVVNYGNGIFELLSTEWDENHHASGYAIHSRSIQNGSQVSLGFIPSLFQEDCILAVYYEGGTTSYQNSNLNEDFHYHFDVDCEAAAFGDTHEIAVTVNPEEVGIVSGFGIYNHGSSATLTATPIVGFHFVNWTLDGEEVSTEAIYSFTATENASYVANFVESTITQTTNFISPGIWSEPSNWSDSTLPSTDAIVFIDAPCQLDQNASVAALTVSDGQSLTLLSGNTLTVTSTLVNMDASGLVIKDGAQLIHSSEGVYATMEKGITGYTDDGGFCLLAVPFTDSVSVPEQMTGGEYDLYLFDQYYPNAEWRNHKADAFSLVRGQGYLYANSNDTTLTLTGQIPPSDEPFSVNLTYDANAINPGYNLVGNPFTCDAYIDRAYYVLNEDGSGINPVEVSASIPIPPCTSVVVKALDENDTVVFTKATH